MNTITMFKRLFGLVLLSVCVNHLTAQEIAPLKSPLQGSKKELKANAVSVVRMDQSFAEVAARLTGRAEDRTKAKVENSVVLAIDEQTKHPLKGSFEATVTYQVYFKSQAKPGTLDSLPQPQQLVVNYDSATGHSYRVRNSFDFKDASEVQVKVISVTTNAQGWDPVPALVLTNEMRIANEIDFDCLLNKVQGLTYTPPAADADELSIRWQLTSGTEYDIEWTYIDKDVFERRYGGGNGNTVAQTVFKNNSSRVSVDIAKNNYAIPLLYEGDGKLLVRVRAVNLLNDDVRIEAQWSDYVTFDYVAGHESHLNWQAATSFAEEGKRKSVVEYFDGSLRNRQTVTKDNSTGQTVVAESKYDYQGRPVIQVLPAPTIESVLKHTPNINPFNTNQPYYKDAYDLLVSDNDCISPAPALAELSKAATYYSNRNPELTTGNNAYIPDAAGFPFTETKYTPDNTGRVAAQGGVGPTHQLGTGHETKYYYAGADQKELDAMFGTEAGVASHFFKNMVRDANGQYSVSYVDMRGRTVATALAGQSPDNVQSLNGEARTITKVLTDPSNNVVKGFTIESSKVLIVDTRSDHNFSYSLLPDHIEKLNCENANICYNCVYDLEITIADDCGNIPFGGVPLVKKATIGGTDLDCRNTNAFTLSFVQNLNEGSYTISKRLTINDAAYQQQRQKFLDNNLCKDLQQFIREQEEVYLNSPANNCADPCGSCEQQLQGGKESFITSFLQQYNTTDRVMAETAYNRAVAECSEKCGTAAAPDYLSVTLKNMQSDVTPGYGQYAKLDEADHDLSLPYEQRVYPEQSIFGMTGGIRKYQSQLMGFSNDQITILRNGVPTVVLVKELTIAEFSQNFKEEWSNELLKLHPEYGQYTNALNLVRQTSYVWDAEYAAVTTYAEAKQNGYLNPTGNASFPYTTAKNDPFFVANPQLRTQMNTYMQHAIAGLSIWQMATAGAFCKDMEDIACIDSHKNNPFPATDCIADLDAAWTYFKAMYLNKKAEFVRSLIGDANIDVTKYRSYFVSPQKMLSTVTGPDIDLDNIDPNNPPDGEAIFENILNKQNYCIDYQDMWWNSLAPCTTEKLAPYKNEILQELSKICTLGTDKEHFTGASSIPPGKTNRFKDFDEVLAFYITAHNNSFPDNKIDVLDCNGSLINFPAPYTAPQMVAMKPILTRPDNCECEQINRLKLAFEKEKKDTDLAAFLKRKYQTEISQADVNELLNRCQQTVTECRFLETPIMLPPVLQCGMENICVPCEAVANAYGNFRNKYAEFNPAAEGNDDTQIKVNTLFAHHLNQQFGFEKTASEYLDFLQQCNVNLDEVAQQVACLNLQKIRRDFDFDVNPLRLRTYLQSNISTPNMITDLTEIYKDGVMQWPDSVRNGSERGWVYHQFDLRGASFCAEGGNSIEFKIMALQDIWREVDDLIYFQISGGRGYTIARNASGVYLRAINGQSLGVVLDSNPKALLNKWHTIKFEVKGAVTNFYFNGRLVYSTSLPADLSNFRAFTLAFFSHHGAVDWVKVADGQGKIVLMDDFNSTSTRAVADPTGVCGIYTGTPVTNCQDAFVQYYNSAQNTSFSFEELSTLYKQTCGQEMDICGISDELKKERLRQLTGNFLASVKPGIVKHKIETAGTILSNDPATLFKDGTLQLPDYQQTGDNWYHGYQIDMNRFCTAEGFAIEHRFKLGNPELTGHIFYPGHRAVQGVFTYYPNGINGGQPGLYLEDVEVYLYDAVPTIKLPGAWLADAGDDYRRKWLTVKTVIRPDKAELYFNGRKIWEYDRDPTVPINQYHNFALYPRGTKTVYDYVKIWDKDGELAYFEDFNNPAAPATVRENFVCSGLPTCSTAFTTYFNQQMGTAYNQAQIQALYTDLKVPLNVCEQSNAESLKFWFAGNYGRYPSHEIVNPSPEIINNGMATTPERYLDSITVGYSHLNFAWPRCNWVVENERAFSAEVKVKLVNAPGSLFALLFHVGPISAYYRFNPSAEGLIVLAHSIRYNGIFRNNGDFPVDTLVNGLNDWVIFKNRYDNGKVQFFINDKLVLQYEIPELPHPVSGLGVGYAGAEHALINLDWFKIYKNDELMHMEDFGSIALTKLPPELVTECRTPPPPTTPDMVLCGNHIPLSAMFTEPVPDACEVDKWTFANSRGTELYHQYKEELKGTFESDYLRKCLEAVQHESFTVVQRVTEYHYTLYYYDQAGNLVKTVPPAGATVRTDEAWLEQVKQARIAGQHLPAAHTMATHYRYNSLNQVTAQYTPDAGKSSFWYDHAGRLVLSQNAKQKSLNDLQEGETGIRYSYTEYDAYSRITEVGQINDAQSEVTQEMTQGLSDRTSLSDWMQGHRDRKRQITLTQYDNNWQTFGGYIRPQNLRNRVAYSVFRQSLSTEYSHGTFYSYDVHGNVKELLQDNGAGSLMAAEGHRYKRLHYKYDLISGKVNRVIYQPALELNGVLQHQPDALYHQYNYDAENRLVDVETSTDGVYWEKDAHYSYYRHGPLSRTVLGHNQVQGLDYVYTLHGWLKGVNGTAVGDGRFDAGKDGLTGSANHHVGRDAFGYSLQYYQGDYTAIGGATANAFAGIATPLGSQVSSLYNGNISSMSINLPSIGDAKVYGYRYDQLNRLVQMQAYNGLNNATNSFAPVATDEYRERISYDPNGNILTYLRNGNAQGLRMDELTYHYGPGDKRNRLQQVTDAVTTNSHTEDIKTQTNTNNYTYDAIGNLIGDKAEGLSTIDWTVYGKISRIVKADQTIQYRYDAAGNRISKAVTKSGSTTTTSYVRDAQGNTMAVYTHNDATVNSGHFTLSEQHLYGSSRLGIYNPGLDLTATPAPPVNMGGTETGISATFIRGQKFFELSNHLGNVLATIRDDKRAVAAGSNTYYEAIVVSANDYYPFGMTMPGRKFNSGAYRYGFNGKENDGETQTQDYGMRIYNPALGKFLSVDPLTKDYPWNSTYAFAENDVIRSIDLDGEEKVITTIFNEPENGKPGIAVITISLTHQIVTAGMGTVNGQYNNLKYSQIYSKGNRNLFLQSLPSSNTEAIEAEKAEITSGNYYMTQVIYDYNLISNPNTTFLDGINWVSSDPDGRGLVWTELSKSDESTARVIHSISAQMSMNMDLKNASNDGIGWNRYIRDQVFPKVLDARAAATNEKINNNSTRNFTILRTTDPGGTGDLSKEEVLAHEGGHSSAYNHLHGVKGYSYRDKGLSSNNPGRVSPTKTNTMSILNDPANRAKSKTIRFDNKKLKK